jgi:hypothetical protein
MKVLRPVVLATLVALASSAIYSPAYADILITAFRGNNPNGVLSTRTDIAVGDIIAQIGSITNPLNTQELSEYARWYILPGRVIWRDFDNATSSETKQLSRIDIIHAAGREDTSPVPGHRPIWIIRDSYSYITHVSAEDLRKIVGIFVPPNSRASMDYLTLLAPRPTYPSRISRDQQAMYRLAQTLYSMQQFSDVVTVCDRIIQQFPSDGVASLAAQLKSSAAADIVRLLQVGAIEAVAKADSALARNNIADACYWAAEARHCDPNARNTRALIQRVRGRITRGSINSYEIAEFYFNPTDASFDDVIFDPSRYRGQHIAWEGTITQQLSATKFVLDGDVIILTTGTRYARYNLAERNISLIGSVQGVERRRTLLGVMKTMPIIKVDYIDGL